MPPLKPTGSAEGGKTLPFRNPCEWRYGRMMNRVRVVLLNAALGPLDYRARTDEPVEPGSIVLAPLGPRQITGVVWDADRLAAGEVEETRLRPPLHVHDVPPIAAPLRRLIEWTGDFYLAPIASLLRMPLPPSSALDGALPVTEYSATGVERTST